ncbi:Phage internal (core) protein [Pseudomonas chlororaphis subsp. aureofaciens]|uniref:hypothetical protein n=1 Tax=Pseudomonas chlororaphis TaxID=587753 RepID=UPI000F5837DB|nr:hypothetical protein [Pseudomonas chlororaphis]AZE12643.1 Phage internal (core) protein [Pseudomonas chlororaphis subsp. aureofaciens]
MSQNEIARALDLSARSTSNRQGFRSGSGAGYQAARITPEVRDSSLADALQNFVKTGTGLYGTYDATQQAQGKERANEIIRKLSPSQRRADTEQGILLYQDDPYAMQSYRELVGSNAAHELDQEIHEKVSLGEFKSRRELDEYRATRLQEGAKSFAEMNGIDAEHGDFQRGFNANITQRNAAVIDQFGRHQSQEFQTNAVLQSRSDIGSLLSDASFMRSPEAATTLTGYINNGLAKGIVPTTSAAVQLLTGALQDATAREGGIALLTNMAHQEIQVGDRRVLVPDVVGADTLEHFKAKAAHFEQSTKADRAEKFHGQLSGIMASTDTISALSALDKLHAQTVGATPTDVMTPERQAIMSSREQLLNRQRVETARLQTDAVKIGQAQSRLAVMDGAWTRKLNGEMVSVDPKLLPTNEMTGAFTSEDEANYANLKMQQIESWSLPESQKTNLMLQYVKADRKDGPFRKIMGEFIDSASAEWDGAVISGNTQRDYPQLNRLRELSKADPVSVAMLYPEKADLVAKLNAMDRYGIDMSVAVEAEKAQSKLTREERNQQARDFTTMIRKSKSAAQYMPAEMNEMARTIYEANVALTGNLSAAQLAVESFVENNTAQFKTTGKPMGAIFKTEILMDPNDVTSWKAGQIAVQAKLDAFSQAHPDVATGGAFVVSRNSQLYIQTLNGRVEPLHMQDIRDANNRAVAKEREAVKRREQDDIKRSQEGFKPYQIERDENARKVREYPQQTHKPK